MHIKKQLLKILLIILSITGFAQDSTDMDTALTDTSFYISGNIDYNLILAAEKGYTDEVLRLLNKGADINTTTWEGITPLMYAIQNQDTILVKILVLNGADMDRKPDNGISGLTNAVIAGNLNIAEYLIRQGADINISDNDGNTPLMYAAAYGYFEMSDMLLYYEADMNKKNNSGTDALMIASYYGDYDIAYILIEAGAAVNSKDNNGYSSIHCASQNGYPELIDLLTANGADINSKTNNGYSPIAIAVAYNNSELLKHLVVKGADVNEKISFSENPVSLARGPKNRPVKKFLLENGGRRNIWPSFNQYTFGLNANWNFNDFMAGVETGLLDKKYNIAMNTGLIFRPWPIRVLEKETPELSYQYRERRTTLFFGIHKRFNLIKTDSQSNAGILLGAKEVYTFGRYRGSLEKPDNKLIAAPVAGVYWNNNYLAINIIYEYLNYGLYKIDPGRINISFAFKINRNKNNYLSKDIKGF